MANERSEFCPQPVPSGNFKTWSDAQLLSTAVRYGEEARNWKNKFLGLLPEIQRRKLYEKQGCSSIFVFAFKVGGVSEEQVSRALNLDKKFENMPALHQTLVSGEVSMNKIARVASIATPSNEKELVEMVKTLPLSALKTFVRDVRVSESVVDHKPENENIFEQEAVYLEQDVRSELLELQNRGVNINEIIRTALAKRKQDIQEEKETIAENSKETASRYIPARTRKIITQEHGTKCSITTCNKPSENIHHTQRFSISKTHDPHYLAPLCKNHHALAHLVDLGYQKKKMRR